MSGSSWKEFLPQKLLRQIKKKKKASEMGFRLFFFLSLLQKKNDIDEVGTKQHC